MNFKPMLVGTALVSATVTASTFTPSAAQAFGVVGENAKKFFIQGSINVTGAEETSIDFVHGEGITYNPPDGLKVAGTESFTNLDSGGNSGGVTLKNINFKPGTTSFNKIKGYADFGVVTLTGLENPDDPTSELSIDGELYLGIVDGGTFVNHGGNVYRADNVEARYVFRTDKGTRVAITDALSLIHNEQKDVFTIDQTEAITLVPEPLTIIGTGIALGFGGLFQREYSKKKKEPTKV